MQANVEKRLVAECSSLRTHTVPLPLPPFYTLMRNVDYYTEHDQVYSSEPLYSHPGGYKMNIVIYAQNLYLSVGMTILRGEFDDQLKWPFDGEITVQAYNRTQKQWCAELTVALNRRVCGLDVVRRCVDSLSYGCQPKKFLPYSVLESDYIHGTNIIRFRVTEIKIFN